MAEANRGDTVRVHYTGTLEDGQVFDSSQGRDPLEFQLGAGQVIPGFEEAIAGMEPGEEKQVTIPSDDAYGPRREDLVMAVGREQFPEDVTPEVGQQLQMKKGERTFVVSVQDVAEDRVVLDANHPLAGRDLNFELELVAIV